MVSVPSKCQRESGNFVRAADNRLCDTRCIFDPFHYGPPPPPPASMDDAETIRLAHASFLSQLTFSWFTELLVRGYKRELTVTDLPKMDESRESALLADRFEANFERRRKEVEQWNNSIDEGTVKMSMMQRVRWRLGRMIGIGRADMKREVGIAMALSDTFAWDFWMAGVYKLVGDLAQTTSPLVTRQIIIFVQESYNANRAGEAMPSIGRGVGFAVLLFFMQM